ncbi:hypothetical protein [Nonomuraea sp. NPDC049709]|uniref:protein kinase domain-containing protein n=1 Tax=Nonomuraea sp. NPDC049709 TaxID=3154736 RepID=UPI00343C8041
MPRRRLLQAHRLPRRARPGQPPSGSLNRERTGPGQTTARQFADDEHAVRRFRREARAAQRVADLCTARVLDAGVLHDRRYLGSEYIEGPLLQHHISGGELLRPDAPLRLAITTAAALATIHGAGVVHRDFKPSNVLLGRDGPQGSTSGSRALDVSQSLTTGVEGTPPFMAPEQFLSRTSPAVDVFACARTMVFAATGRAAFGFGPLPVVMCRILNLDPDLTGVPGELASLRAASLAKDPRDRPTAEQLLTKLVRVGAPPPPTSTQQPMTSSPARSGVHDGAVHASTGPGDGPHAQGGQPIPRASNPRLFDSKLPRP